MAISITHPFVSAKSDGADATLVRPSNWNDEHTLEMATGKLLGRGTVGTGTFEEITVSTGLLLSGTTLTATAAAGTQVPPQGRLTLQTATPVMTTTQSAKTTIYYTPYVGNQVPIWDGSTMTMTTFAEVSAATSDTTKSPAAIGASKVNDWFVWSDAGTVRIGHGPDWTSDTARSAGTALVMQNGVLLNNASITNGPAASRGTYVGTTRSNASSQLDWIYGGSGAGGVRGVHYVWNMYNRRQICSSVNDTTASVAYTTATWAPFLGGANNSIDFVSGLAEDNWFARSSCYGSSTGLGGAIAIGYDVTNAPSGGSYGTIGGANSVIAIYSATAIGKHTVNFIYYGNAGLVFAGNSAYANDGLFFEFLM